MEFIQFPNKNSQSLQLIDVKKELRRCRMQTVELKKITIRCLRPIKRCAQYLAHQHNCHQIEIYRLAVHMGIPHLHELPGVADVRDVKIYLLENAADLDDIRAQETRFFDFKINETVLFTGRIAESDISQCDNLSDILSLSRSIICQMAMIHTLVRTEIPVQFHNEMAEVFIRFRKKVKRWGERAVKAKKNCEKIATNFQKIDYAQIYGEEIGELD